MAKMNNDEFENTDKTNGDVLEFEFSNFYEALWHNKFYSCSKIKQMFYVLFLLLAIISITFITSMLPYAIANAILLSFSIESVIIINIISAIASVLSLAIALMTVIFMSSENYSMFKFKHAVKKLLFWRKTKRYYITYFNGHQCKKYDAVKKVINALNGKLYMSHKAAISNYIYSHSFSNITHYTALNEVLFYELTLENESELDAMLILFLEGEQSIDTQSGNTMYKYDIAPVWIFNPNRGKSLINFNRYFN